MTQKPRKRIFLVNREFQLRYVRSAILVGLVSTVLTTILILYPLYEFKIIRIASFLPQPVLLAMAIAAFANVAFIGYMTIFFTHRVAGPMFALTRQMRIIEEGSFDARLRIRDDDEFRNIMRGFNAMVDSLKGVCESQLAQIDALINDGAVSDGVKERLVQLRNQISSRLEQNKRI
jgi:methyl-accepting chemotaxis protein